MFQIGLLGMALAEEIVMGLYEEVQRAGLDWAGYCNQLSLASFAQFICPLRYRNMFYTLILGDNS